MSANFSYLFAVSWLPLTNCIHDDVMDAANRLQFGTIAIATKAFSFTFESGAESLLLLCSETEPYNI
jgi:spore coat protein U-like protein